MFVHSPCSNAAATSSLMITATTMEANNNVTYKMAIYTLPKSMVK